MYVNRWFHLCTLPGAYLSFSLADTLSVCLSVRLLFFPSLSHSLFILSPGASVALTLSLYGHPRCTSMSLFPVLSMSVCVCVCMCLCVMYSYIYIQKEIHI